MLFFLWQLGSWLLGGGLIAFVGWLVKRRYQSKRLKSVWVELIIYGLVVYTVFTVGMTLIKTWERADNELASIRDDFEQCRDPEYRKRKAKAGHDTCDLVDKYYDRTCFWYMMDLLTVMGPAKVFTGFSLTELFVNLTQSSYWTFVIVFVTFVAIFSILVTARDTYSAVKAPKMDWSKLEIRDKSTPVQPAVAARETCRDLGNGKEACLPVSFK